MGRSSTTFSGKWLSGKTTVVRVPQILAQRVVEYARELDTQANVANDPEAIYRTAFNVELGRVNTNGHFYEILRTWKSPTHSIAKSSRVCRRNAAT